MVAVYFNMAPQGSGLENQNRGGGSVSPTFRHFLPVNILTISLLD